MKEEGSQRRENSGSHLEHVKHETQSAASRQVKTYGSISKLDSRGTTFQTSKISNQAPTCMEGGLLESISTLASQAKQTLIKT